MAKESTKAMARECLVTNFRAALASVQAMFSYCGAECSAGQQLKAKRPCAGGGYACQPKSLRSLIKAATCGGTIASQLESALRIRASTSPVKMDRQLSLTSRRAWIERFFIR